MSDEAIPMSLKFKVRSEIMSNHMPLTVITDIQAQESISVKEDKNDIPR